MIDAIFASELAKDALYVPDAGVPVPVRVIRKSPDVDRGFGQSDVTVSTNVFEIRVSEIASPRAGDSLEMANPDGTVGGPAAEAFRVQGVPATRDPDRLVWTLDTHPI
jgi:hypothetical protein